MPSARLPQLNQLQVNPARPATAVLQGMEFEDRSRRTDIAQDRNAIMREGQALNKEQTETMNMFKAMNVASQTAVNQEEFNETVSKISGKDYKIKFHGQDMEQQIAVGGKKYKIKGKSQMILDFYRKGEEDPTWITDPKKSKQATEWMAKNGLTIEPIEEEVKAVKYKTKTIYGPKSQTKEVSIAEGKDYTPPEGWSLNKPSSNIKSENAAIIKIRIAAIEAGVDMDQLLIKPTTPEEAKSKAEQAKKIYDKIDSHLQKSFMTALFEAGIGSGAIAKEPIIEFNAAGELVTETQEQAEVGEEGQTIIRNKIPSQ